MVSSLHGYALSCVCFPFKNFYPVTSVIPAFVLEVAEGCGSIGVLDAISQVPKINNL